METRSPARFLPGGRAGLQALLSGDSVDCSDCHADIATQWAGSAHRFASFNNPYYAAAVEVLRKERSEKAGRFCAGCHDPLLLVDDSIAQPQLSRATPAAQAGLTCLLCHSITETHDLRGNGNYTVSAGPVPPPRGQGEAPAGPSPHGARLRPPILGQSQLCAACHKVGLTEDITQDRWLRGQDDYDAWQQSMAGGNGVAAIYRNGGPGQAQVRRCQDCHMPLVLTASGQRVRSHRFLAANTALPALREDAAMLSATTEFLRGSVSLDLVVMQPDGAGTAAPAMEDQVPVAAETPIVMIDVVLRNRRVGHRFPGGTGDSNDAFVQVEAEALRGGKKVGDDTHVLRAQPVDETGHPLLHRDVQHMRGVVYDTSLSPADPQVVRYRLDLRDLGPPQRLGPVRVRAALRYRKFSPAYARFACAALPPDTQPGIRQRCQAPPIIDIASAERMLVPAPLSTATPARESARQAGPPLWERYLDHGLGLADGLVDSASEALPSLSRAAALMPDRAETHLGLARLYLALARTGDVLAECARAEAVHPDHPAALWLRAVALYRTYKWKEARPYLERATLLLPQDRNVLALLARVRGLLGDAAGALQVADRMLQIDPESEEGHYQRLLSLRDLGRPAEAQAAEHLYLRYRRPVERDQELRARFRLLDPARAAEDTPAHVHPLRGVPPRSAPPG